MTAHYRERAGKDVALTFADNLEVCVGFIASRPLACSIYGVVAGKEFRKRRLRRFPIAVFFRLQGNDTIVLEALNTDRMDVAARFKDDIKDPD